METETVPEGNGPVEPDEDIFPPVRDEKEKPKDTKSKYMLLARLDDETSWREMGDVKAEGPEDAMIALIEHNDSVKGAIEDGRCELVAVNQRFWVKRRPSYTPPQLKF